ncbi:MAG TPA: DUF5719 family protein [Acidimicrobiales bacterium]|nr:DUF5719 family protein [Acidimicrobiales bacterium]
MSPAHHNREPRWRVLLLVVAVLAGVAIGFGTEGSTAPSVSAEPAAQVSPPDAESSAWYCTGQSTPGGVAPNALVMTNTLGRPVTATVTTITDAGAVAHTAVSVPPRSVVSPSLPALSPGSWEAQIVIVDGGGVAVSQLVQGSSGWDESPCTSTTSSQWFFPGGTTDGALDVSLLNPTATPVVVDLSFITKAGAVHPINYQGIVVQPGSVVMENVASEVQNDSTVSTVVTTRTGRIVASVLQAFAAPSAGLSLVPGSPTVASHWAIPQAEEATGGSSEIDVFNPGTTPENVTVRLRLPSGALAPLTSTVGASSTWVLATSAQTRIPVGAPYSAEIEAAGGAGVVVGRTIVLPASAAAPQAGVALAVDGPSQSPSGKAWIVPPPGAGSSPPVSGAAPGSLALMNTSSRPERYSAGAMSSSGQTQLAAGTIAPGATVLVSGSNLSRVAADPIMVRSDGAMGVSEDVGPTGGLGVVTMPGFPLARAINS